MKSQRFEEPRLFTAFADELPLSNRALLELTGAVLAKGVPLRFRAHGCSMAPFLTDGDVVTVSPLQGVAPRTGEVVAFARGEEDELVVHRVVGLSGGAFWIQGDAACKCTDGLIPSENILGRVTRVQRNGHDVWLGLGPERIVIAWLSRTRRLVPIQMRLTSWLAPLRRR